MVDVAVVGAGPVGLACAIEAKRRGLSAVTIDKGAIVNSILGYPIGMEFFSTPELIEIGGHPFSTTGYKPVREEALEYYRRVAEIEDLNLRLYERVIRVEGEKGAFRVVTDKDEIAAGHVAVAIGFFDHPNMLDVPGEDLPKVTHYYSEAHSYARQKVAVIGARNSAAKAALDCYRHGADVTMIVRSPDLSDKIKYWILPDLENRIKEGSIEAYFSSIVDEIKAKSIVIRTVENVREASTVIGGEASTVTGREDSTEIGRGDSPVIGRDEAVHEIENDWVLAMTGYHPDYAFLDGLGIEIADDAFRSPVYDDVTFETSRPGMYIAGTVCGGYQTNRWFIENGRFHARQIAAHIAGGDVEEVDFDEMHWKTAE